MERMLRFVTRDARIDVPGTIVDELLLGEQSPEVTAWISEVARRLNSLASGIVICIGKLRLSLEKSRLLAHSIGHALCDELIKSGAPDNMSVEIANLLQPSLIKHYKVRTLLPHHDGGHCTYLSPSMLDNPDWKPQWRSFSNEGYTTTAAHKLYQGIFIVEPGEGLSITTYYDWLAVLHHAYEYNTGNIPDSLDQVMSWLGLNILRALELQPQHRCGYLTLGGALGGTRLSYLGTPIHRAEADFSSEEIKMFPELEQYNVSVDKSRYSPTERFLSQVLTDTMGVSWPEFRNIYEVCLPSERFDLVLAHNLTLLHGGLMGGPGRQLEPICMTLDSPIGIQYEQWLAQSWRRGVSFLGKSFSEYLIE